MDEQSARVFTPMTLLASGSKLTLERAMQQLNAAKINCSIISFWGREWMVQIGDELNGIHATKYFDNESIGDIPQWLIDKAKL